ncbi:MAG: hypothetical protein ACLFSQ_09430 [Candidatus Zixiibacteriota bacterium]
MRKTTIIILLISLISLFAQQDIEVESIGSRDASKKVLVAGEFSQFRYDIIKKVAEKFSDVYFETSTFKEAKEKSLDNYEAVIVVGQLKGWMIMNSKEKRLLRKAGKDKGILFITAGDPDYEWTDKKTGVEMITGASEDANTDEFVKSISDQLDEKL